MIIPLSGGVVNGAGLDVQQMPVKVGDGIRLIHAQKLTLLDEYKVYENGVARCVDGQYVVASSGRRWTFTAAAVVDL